MEDKKDPHTPVIKEIRLPDSNEELESMGVDVISDSRPRAKDRIKSGVLSAARGFSKYAKERGRILNEQDKRRAKTKRYPQPTRRMVDTKLGRKQIYRGARGRQFTKIKSSRESAFYPLNPRGKKVEKIVDKRDTDDYWKMF